MRQRGEPTAPLASLDDLRPMTRERGPFLSLYMSLRPASEDMAQANKLQWEGLREKAAGEGAPAALLATVDTAVGDAHRVGEGLCAVAARDGFMHLEHLAEPPDQELATWGKAPVLAPLIRARQWLQPHIVALVDRTGAEVTAHGVAGFGDEGSREWTTTVHGSTYPIRKVQPGGLSQRRYQQRAEETWHHNMTEVAKVVADEAERCGARLVALGGDQRATGLVLDQLPPAVRQLVLPIAATRAEDGGSSTGLDQEVRSALQSWAADQLDHTMSIYREELGQHDRATAGAETTLAALRASRVAQLLVQPAADGPTVWIGSTPEQVALLPEDVPAGPPVRPAPLADAAVSAALATGAEVQVFSKGQGPEEGVGALLRW